MFDGYYVEPIVSNMIFCPVPKGRHKTDPYGDIEMVCIVGAVPCACPGMWADVAGDGKRIGEMVG